VCFLDARAVRMLSIVLHYTWNVYDVSVRMYVRMLVCTHIPYSDNSNTPLFLADMT